ncbi:MAG: methyltransferase [Candidatus Paceibacterota bacterium]|jgi:protein-S-isoprenylcysteine O-methyltransferase Ste14
MDQNQPSNPGNKPQGGEVDRLSAGAFMVYLALFLLGVLAESFFPLGLGIDTPLLNGIGVLLVVVGPVLIFWAQSSIRSFHATVSEGAAVNFSIGPYRYMRNPTYLGLTFLVAGFGFFANAGCVVLSSVLSYIIVRFSFLRKEEQLLAEKYGGVYLKYMEKVERWF